jgi:hypothetical protein
VNRVAVGWSKGVGRARGAEAKVAVRAADYKGGGDLFRGVSSAQHRFTVRQCAVIVGGREAGGKGAVVRRCGEVL